MSNELDVAKSPPSIGEPVRKTLSSRPLSRNRFLKIFARNPAEYHPVFYAYDKAPQMPIVQIANTALAKGEKVMEIEIDAAIKEGWEQEGGTLQKMGDGLGLMRKPEEIFSAPQFNPSEINTEQAIIPASSSLVIETVGEPTTIIEGIAVYPMNEEVDTRIQSPEPQTTITENIASQPTATGDNLRQFIIPLRDGDLEKTAA